MGTKPQSIAIVGGGAMGSVFAGLFAAAGHQPVVISRPGAHIEAIAASGLRLEGASGDRTVQVRALTAPPNEVFDLIILAMKATQVAGALQGLAPMAGPQTVILTMQNGLGAADMVAEFFGEERVAVGIAAGFGASVVSPGHARHAGMGAIQIGAYGSLPADRISEIAELWRSAGFNAEAADDIVSMQWEKLICNASFSAPCAISGLTVGEALADPALGEVCIAAGLEAWEIARAAGVALKVSDPEAYIRAFAQRVAAAKPSLLQDLEVGRQTEVDYINGAVPREAARIGLAAPVNAVLTALVKSFEGRRGGA